MEDTLVQSPQNTSNINACWRKWVICNVYKFSRNPWDSMEPPIPSQASKDSAVLECYRYRLFYRIVAPMLFFFKLRETYILSTFCFWSQQKFCMQRLSFWESSRVQTCLLFFSHSISLLLKLLDHIRLYLSKSEVSYNLFPLAKSHINKPGVHPAC